MSANFFPNVPSAAATAAAAASLAFAIFLSGCAGFDRGGRESSTPADPFPAEALAASLSPSVVLLEDERFIVPPSGALTSSPGEVLSGSWSVKGSWSGAGDYHPYLYTDCSVLPLAPGATYRLSFDYRMLSLPDRGFETIFYSPTAGSLGQWLGGSVLQASDSPSGTVTLECTLGNYSDYQIRWNIVGTGSIAVDNIRIEEIKDDAGSLVAEADLEATVATIDVNRETISAKLENRRTVPVFYPWGRAFSGERSDTHSTPYGLLWTGEGISRDLESAVPEIGPTDRFLMNSDADTLYLISLEWHYWAQGWRTLSKDSKFYLDEIYEYHVGSEYAPTLMINFEHEEWPAVMARKAANYRKAGYDGIMLDWWHDGAGNNRRSPEAVQKARLAIIRAMRESAGDSFILLGNVNWSVDDPTSQYLSGVFLELWKEKPGKGYAVSIADESAEGWNPSIERMEEVLLYWDGALQWPKIVAFEPWKITEGDYIASRDSPENRKLAALFAAMGCVIPENGYVLYADNNGDWTGGDHQHAWYDCYRIDLGKPVSRMNRVAEGIAWREYEKGYIAYNRTESPIDVQIAGGRRLVLAPLEGIFVKETE